MTKDELKNHINLYKKTESIILELDNNYGIQVWNSYNPNFYNNYNLMIHNLLLSIFGEDGVELIEEYIFDQITITFDELWECLTKYNNEQ